MPLGPRQQQVLDLFDKLPPKTELSAGDIARRLKLQRQVIASTLRLMVQKKQLLRRNEKAKHPAFAFGGKHNGKKVLFRRALPEETT